MSLPAVCHACSRPRRATRWRGIFFVTPDKKRDKADSFTRDDSLWNADVAHLRIHVERAIRHTRTFAMMSTRFRATLTDLMSTIATVCTLLCNFQRPVGGSDFGLVGDDGEAVCAYTLNWGAPVTTSPPLNAAFEKFLEQVNARLAMQYRAEQEAEGKSVPKSRKRRSSSGSTASLHDASLLMLFSDQPRVGSTTQAAAPSPSPRLDGGGSSQVTHRPHATPPSSTHREHRSSSSPRERII